MLTTYGQTDLINYMGNKIASITYNLNGSDVTLASGNFVKTITSTSIEISFEITTIGTYQDFRYLDASGNVIYEQIETINKDIDQDNVTVSTTINLSEVIS